MHDAWKVILNIKKKLTPVLSKNLNVHKVVVFIFLGCEFHEYFDIKAMKIILNKGDVQHEAQGNRIRVSVQKEDVLYPISFERYSALGQFKKVG